MTRLQEVYSDQVSGVVNIGWERVSRRSDVSSKLRHGLVAAKDRHCKRVDIVRAISYREPEVGDIILDRMGCSRTWRDEAFEISCHPRHLRME